LRSEFTLEHASDRDPPGEGRIDACSDQERIEGGPGDRGERVLVTVVRRSS
jgi:hypothetical protein